jgi:hypothetical protein
LRITLMMVRKRPSNIRTRRWGGARRTTPGGLVLLAFFLYIIQPAASAEAGFDAAQRRCRDTIAASGTKLAAAATQAVASCHKARNVGRLPASTNCNSLTEADDRGRVARARQKLTDRVAGPRGQCTGPTLSPGQVSHIACAAPCDVSYPTVETFNDVAGCAACLVESEVEAMARYAGGTPPVPLSREVERCHATLTKGLTKHHRRVLSRRRKCQKRAEAKGTVTAFACGAGEADGATSSRVSTSAKIARRCADANLTQVDSCETSGPEVLADCALLESVRSADRLFGLLYGAESPGRARILWEHSIQPALSADCRPCHAGERFGFASLKGGAAPFSQADTDANHESFFDLISLDHPASSRLLSKALGDVYADGQVHGGGPQFEEDSEQYNRILEWILEEKAEQCSECGLNATVQYLAYVEQPRIFWALERDPIRSDHGLRDRARIYLQPLQPHTLRPEGTPIDFLGETFCGADERCDFGHLAVSHDASMLAFECRLGEPGEDWVNDVRWNVCIAEIGPDGTAVSPRVLRAADRHSGETVSRSDPFGLYAVSGLPLKGAYDHHFQMRRRDDGTPTFGPNDEWVYLSSRGLDPRTGSEGTRTYHGFEHVNNIVAVRTDGSEIRSVYRNEGGQADFPFFRRNGNLVFHTWNLERMDRHLYTQSTHDGMMELPVLLGRVQGENRWGKAVELAGGAVLGMTGRRRGSAENYVPFLGDHTLGAGLADNPAAITILDVIAHEQIAPWPNGYCTSPPDGDNCVIDRWYEDPAYAPDGRAFISHNPEATYVSQGEAMYLEYSSGSTVQDRLASMLPYTPERLGLYLTDHRGNVEQVLEPASGFMLRYPAWVGLRHPPRAPTTATDEASDSATLHIANLPVWLSFRQGPDQIGGTSKTGHMAWLDTIVALRVLVKDMDGNACLNDGRPYRFAVNAGFFDHPTHLGINNATGYRHLRVPENLGGNGWGDIPLKADGSVSLRVPAGELMLLQGIDADGHVVHQHARVFAMPPGQHIDTSVRRDQYDGQCASCHGTIDAASTFVPLTEFESLPFTALDFATEASAEPPVNLTDPAVVSQTMTFLHRLRPLLDRDCVSCHSGATPAGELNLTDSYSPTANYPAGKWVAAYLADSNYMDFIPELDRVPGYDYSVAWSWLMRQDQNEYRSDPNYAALLTGYTPLADLAPWDPAYQNLFANDGSVLVYLSGFRHSTFGRSDLIGGNSRDSWLVEILSGRDISPVRDFTGPDHSGYFSEQEVRNLMAVIDLGFPYMARCDDKFIPDGPNAGLSWGDPFAQLAP